MKRTLWFLVLVALLAVPIVAFAQAAPPPTPAVPIFTSDPIGYLIAHKQDLIGLLTAVFLIARVVIRYVPVPQPRSIWAAIYTIINNVSLPTPKAATPLTSRGVMPAVPPPPAQPPPAGIS